MKKNFREWLCLAVVMLLTVSCSENAKLKDLLKQIPADADVVLVGNLKTVMESAGGSLADSKIKLPSNIADELPSSAMNDIDDVNAFLKKSGIDLDACAFFVDYNQNYPVIVFSLTDKKQFVDAIEDKGFREKTSEDDIVFYTKKTYASSDPDWDDYDYIAVNGSYAYWIQSVWVGSKFKPVRYLQDMIEAADDKNYMDTPYGDYIIDGNAGGIALKWPKDMKKELRKSGMPSDMLSVYDGVICMRANLSDNQCTVDIKLYDKDGHEINADFAKQFTDTSATIDGKALAMLGKDESLIYTLSLKNFAWGKYADWIADASDMSRSERSQLNAVISYFEKINGTVAVGFGLKDGLTSIESMYNENDILAQFSTTMVIETKNGKAKQLIEDMKGFLEEAQIPFNESGSGFSIDIRELGGELNVKHFNNFVVLANHPIKENNYNALVKNTNFTDYLFAFCIGLNKENPLMRDLNIKNDVKFMIYSKPETFETSMMLEIDGKGDSGVIAKAVNIVLGIAQNADEIAERFERARYSNYYDYEPDYYYDEVTEAIEEVAEEATEVVEEATEVVEDWDY